MTNPQTLETIGAFLAFIATLMVFSYIFLGDNEVFRVAVYVFVGVSAGYASAVVWYSVLAPKLIQPIITAVQDKQWGPLMLYLVPLLLSLLLLTKLSPNLGRLGNAATAYLVGVGAAVAVGGAVLGTIFPQVAATTGVFNMQKEVGERLLNGSIFLVGTLSTLIYFHFGARSVPNAPNKRNVAIDLVGKIGQFFIAVTFGVMFAGVYAATLTALIERVQFLWQFIQSIPGMFGF